MSILIKGPDLPKVYGPAILTVYECIDGQTIPREYKLSATQMQAVPPHGRLIDADTLESLIYERISDLDYKADAFDILRIVQDMPTIIEAEGEAEK